MSKQQGTFTCVAAVVVASVLWGTTGAAASFAPDVSPLAIGAIATGGGGFLMSLRALQHLCKQWSSLLRYKHLVVYGGLCVAVYPLAFYSSMRLAGVAIGTVVSIASAPLFAVLLEKQFNNKPVTVKWLLSFVLGVAGILCLALAKPDTMHEPSMGFDREWGIMLGLVAGLTYAAYSWTGKAMIVRGINASAAMAAQFGVASVMLLPSLYFTGENLLASDTNISVALYMAFIPMFLGYVLFGYGLQRIDASIATLITLLEPVVATLLAVWLLAERFSPRGWVGILLISLCIMVQMMRTKKKA
ncbi:DMT family transporter [Aestuariibacter sp. A3R04]|uniref:DMT family transporter n=1 Tax=Aestuariibacter sp. A3R04 TaxID=2841571 RepID=UPI001C08626D|nr:EamA family transporter [Aestuariibacter sp. A3R04]MBU3020978.1 EamA family transporter [Aestuariibacter sp. A3R04]